jgi:hypothetical protein
MRFGGTLTVSNGLAFGSTIMQCFYTSAIVAGIVTLGEGTGFSLIGGAGCTGFKWVCGANSVINLGAGVADTLPGNQPGVLGSAYGIVPLHGSDGSIVY